MGYVIGILVILGLAGSGIGYVKGRSDGRELERVKLIAAQRDQVADLNRRLVEAQRAKAQQNAKFLALPDVRNRLCAIKGAADDCCKPEPARCEP